MSMVEGPVTAMGSVLLHDITWDQYSGLVDAMSEHRFRHTYNRGTLEIFGETRAGSAATKPDGLKPAITKDRERSVVLYDIDPGQYADILKAMGDKRLRHSYFNWTLEIMSPSQKHEWENRFLERLLDSLAYDLEMNILSLGSWTLKPSGFQHGAEPDSCFYIQNEPRVRHNREIDLDKDPPPDLAIEIDFTNSCIKRLPIYAAIGVPEIWRWDGSTMRFLQLAGDAYEESPRSAAFPCLPPKKLKELLDASGEKTDLQLVKEFVAWVREQDSK